jgi:hypothetical protein
MTRLQDLTSGDSLSTSGPGLVPSSRKVGSSSCKVDQHPDSLSLFFLNARGSSWGVEERLRKQLDGKVQEDSTRTLSGHNRCNDGRYAYICESNAGLGAL